MLKRLVATFIWVLIMLPISVFANGVDEEAAQTIVFADLTWDSAMVHNRIVGFIIEHGLEKNYKAEYLGGATIPSLTGLSEGDIDIDMESWHSNFQDLYEDLIEKGKIVDLGKNLPDAPQGWYIPRYVLEGDSERGIDPVAPDLDSVADLDDYAHLFADPEDPKKGLIYLGVSGWAVTEVQENFFDEQGLGASYNKSIPGSAAALAATMAAAFDRGEPWIGYWWEPTAIMGRLDMVRLPGTELPPADVNILVNPSLLDTAPDIVTILKKYDTTVAVNNEFLLQMETMNTDAEGAAIWFLENREDIWLDWVDADVAARVRDALASL